MGATTSTDAGLPACSESVPCPICDTLETRLLYEGPHGQYAMGRCRGCGLVRQNPRLRAAHIREIDYDGNVQRMETFFDGRGGREGLAHWQSQPLTAYEAGVRAVDAHRTKTGPKGIWLDVGASTGSLLVAARNAGWQVRGVELGAGQVKLCKEVHGIEVSYGALHEAKLREGYAEVVSYRHTLEHVHEVVEELEEARRVLAADGLMLIEVPNVAGLRYKSGRLRTALGLRKNFWPSCNIPQHVYYFDAGTLRRLLKTTGLEIVWWGTYGKTRPKAGLLRRAYDRVRDGLRFGNKLRAVVRPVPRG
jgi:SAM-dependent methyltransferase